MLNVLLFFLAWQVFVLLACEAFAKGLYLAARLPKAWKVFCWWLIYLAFIGVVFLTLGSLMDYPGRFVPFLDRRWGFCICMACLWLAMLVFWWRHARNLRALGYFQPRGA